MKQNREMPEAHNSLTEVAWPSPSRAWLLVSTLLVAYAVGFVDRQILTLLVEPVKRDLGITDTQFSLLTGLAFTFFYTVMAIPFGWLADRGSRRNLVAASLVCWGAMTAVCGMASTFLLLFIARIGVGIGEAGLSPAAYSMIADSFPMERRTRPLGVYAMGSIMGVGVAFLIGGAVVEWANSTPPVVLPILGELKTWQFSFLIVSIPGPLIGLAMLLLHEPKRREQRPAGNSTGLSFGAFLRQRWRVLSMMSVGYALISVPPAAYLAWTPAFMIREYGWKVGDIGAALGGVLLVFNTSGIVAGATWADRLAGKGIKDGVIKVTAASGILGLPFAIAAPFASTGGLAMAIVAGMSFMFGLGQGLWAAGLQAITPNRLRARMLALQMLIINTIAITIGPTSVALISDYWLLNPTKIGVAVAISSAALAPIGVTLTWAARKLFIYFAAIEADS
jgi:predicted MFS family arabinose efflux permease